MINRHLTFAAIALGTCGLLAGCRESPDPESFRLIKGTTHDQLDLEAARRTVFSWHFATAEDLAVWTVENVDGEVESSARGLTLRSSSNDPFLWRRAAFDTTAVDTIRIHLDAAAEERPGAPDASESASDPGMVQLFWAAADEEFFRTRQMSSAQPVAELEDGGLIYELPVNLDPSWSGEIDRLRLDPTNLPGTRVRLLRIEGLREELPDPSLPHDITLGSERRPALLVPPDSPRELEVDVPPNAVLTFGYGLLGGVGKPHRLGRPGELRVSAVAAGRRATRLQSSTGTLLTAVLAGAESTAARGWLEARVDLAGFAGRRLILRFESALPAGVGGVPVVSNPELYSTRPTPQPPNVVLISIDTLRADRLSLYGYRKVTSPAIDAWARDQGVTFRGAIAPSPWTLPSHVSMLTGLDALKHGVNYLSTSISPQLPTLTKILRGAGYRTAAITGGGFMGPDYGFEHGFDRFHWWPGEAGAADEVETLGELALEWLDDLSDRPFFLFFHTYEVHSPYHRREPFYSAFGGRPEDLGAEPLSAFAEAADGGDGFRHWHRLVWANGDTARVIDLASLDALYDSAIAHTDGVVGRLLEHLRLLDLAADTIVVLTSDHGESLGEQGQIGHGNLYDANLLVPLVISYPRRLPEAQRIEQQVRSVDLLPTVLALAGIEAPPGLDGTSLLPLIEGGQAESHQAPPAWSYGGWPNYGLALRQNNALKYIFNDAPWPAICGHEELYEIDRDPGQTANRAATSRDTSQLRRQARAYLHRHASGLMLQLANRHTEPFELKLEGPRFLAWTVKWLDGACPDMHRLPSGGLGITVHPGQTTTLVWQRAQAQELEITAGIGRPADPDHQRSITVSEPQELRDRWSLHYADSRWHWSEAGDEDAWTGIRVWWSEPRGVEPGSESPAQARQLEALGYLN